jgi:hypothetical protein
MSLQLIEMSTTTDFTEFIYAMWESYNNPPQAGFDCAIPFKSTLAETLVDPIERFSRELKEDPTVHYFSVVDTSTAEHKIVGGGSWNVYLEDPYAKEPENDRGIYWWPEGSDSRKFTEQIFMDRLSTRLERCRRPHVRK